ncbi:Lipopolysaccharide-modifying protein [Trema orientale]|uniref:Lipopolysaccharide-modifying protein n=1 Tax=Trema orientale TaxID=63057 RepID=A0A2P5ELT3_TREOI|nr:Lipopolysaccharide-modifying protein [Trema orientale]
MLRKSCLARPLFLPLLVVAAFLLSFCINTSKLPIDNFTDQTTILSQKNQNPPRSIEFPLNCTIFTSNFSKICPKNSYPTTVDNINNGSIDQSSMCPDYFRWIHEDLRPWSTTGITRDMVERAKNMSHFRLVIVNGKAYIDKYKKSIQTRDIFTIWGILQLLRRYPGKVSDLELMFDSGDRPKVRARGHRGTNSTDGPPPLFRYCGDRWTVDIVFPDWSFWGWAEINIKPWESMLKEIKEGNEKIKWMEREPYAYWKGNPHVAEGRRDLLKCNVSDSQDWNARLFVQDWILESQQGYRHSDLSKQCTHRYKIYIEGWAWSVSEKYILSCDSVTLIVKPRYYDFFTRSLQPLRHYWPIRDDDKCKSIKFAVDWGNKYKQKAQAIGKAASDFIQQELNMNYVYDYMFHLLNEYSKLLKFEPKIPDGAVELCPETMACLANGLEKTFMMESLVKSPATTAPCTIPPPYEPQLLRKFYSSNLNSIRRVENWENKYWESMTKQQKE